MSGRSEYRVAADGLPARVSGPWAEEKLEILRKYAAIVNTAVRTKWNHRCYVDLMAGGGRCVLKTTGREFDGSPLVALRCEPSFTAVVLVEAHAGLCAALRARTTNDSDRTTIIEGDCNAASVIAAIRSAVPRDALSIVFVDNLGLDVTLSTISRIVASRAMDLVVTFQVNDLTRNAGLALSNETEGARWNRFFGTETWRQVIADYEARTIAAPDVGAALGDFYAERLMTLRYTHREQLERMMTNTKGAPLYRVMFFSKHPLGKRLFSAVSGSRQGRLFPGDR